MGQNNPPQTLKDSLLMRYTMEELKAMSADEMWNIVRVMRGLKPIDYIVAAKEFDDNGVKIVAEIPSEATSDIESIVNQIEQEKASYRQEVFPNAYADVLEYYFRAFYQSFIDRDFDPYRYSYYKEPLQEYAEMEESEFSNASKRTYYFNKEGALRLIRHREGTLTF